MLYDPQSRRGYDAKRFPAGYPEAKKRNTSSTCAMRTKRSSQQRKPGRAETPPTPYSKPDPKARRWNGPYGPKQQYRASPRTNGQKNGRHHYDPRKNAGDEKMAEQSAYRPRCEAAPEPQGHPKPHEPQPRHKSPSETKPPPRSQPLSPENQPPSSAESWRTNIFHFTGSSVSVERIPSEKKILLQFALTLRPHRIYDRLSSLDKFTTTSGVPRWIGRVNANIRDPMAELIDDFTALSLDDNDP